MIIVGSGPAGLTAAIYSAWMKFRTLVLEAQNLRGRASQARMIRNFPGFPRGIMGIKLVEKNGGTGVETRRRNKI
jgi:thioredoxin reductase (NADPH)